MKPDQPQPRSQCNAPRFGEDDRNQHSFTFKLPAFSKKSTAIYPFGQHLSDEANGKLDTGITANANDGRNNNRPNSDTTNINSTYVSFTDIDSLASEDQGINRKYSSDDSSNILGFKHRHHDQPQPSGTKMVVSMYSSSLEQVEMRGQADEVSLKKTLPPVLPSRRPFRASCTHPTMTRVYGVNHRCDTCGRYPPFGWLYRCTQDREELLRQMIHVGSDQATFDDLGKQLVSLVQPRPRGPETRADTIGSFFNEITPEQLQNYRPDQVATILKQRENVKVVIQQDATKQQNEVEEQIYAFAAIRESRFSAGAQTSPQMPAPKPNEARWQELERERPWVPRPEMECTYKVCQQCRPSGADRISMSLDAIAKGDIPATAATGFGFHHFGQRPVCDVSIVAKLGLSHVEASSVMEEGHEAHLEQSDSGTLSSAGYSMANLDDLMARHEQQFREWQQSRQQRRSEAISALQSTEKGHLPRSPGSPDLNHVAETKEAESLLPRTVTTDMEAREMKKGRFGPSPLVVDEGIAVLEESVELHVPDVVTQI